MGETPVVIKLNGTDGDVTWTYEGRGMSRAVFHAVAVDPATGWIIGAGTTEGTWLLGAAKGGYDFAAVLLDGEGGDELFRYQDGTTGSDYLFFAGFDSLGGLVLGGTTWNAGYKDFVATKFTPFDVAAMSALLAGGSILAGWEIGMIAGGGGAFLLLLLGLCESTAHRDGKARTGSREGSGTRHLCVSSVHVTSHYAWP